MSSHAHSGNGQVVREQLKKSERLGKQMDRSGNGVIKGLRRAAAELRRSKAA